ncbi:helix-turn-helix domain-containing protein [Aquabacterium sp.]|uniref:helix-turn-helix domain-containing protein n=1 Tax=Aquabacterium sp. TaxID=1872578 RepID=UPI002BD4FE71|nr:hypothetical protein [Aquabacterium sp.]HSW04754.1 hypothetical protein [Aquabacterium sp.]
MSQFERLSRLKALLSTGRAVASVKLQQTLGISPATLKRNIAHLRDRMNAPLVFDRLLNTSLSTVQKWEIGQKRPTGTALKLLHLVQKRGLEVIA